MNNLRNFLTSKAKVFSALVIAFVAVVVISQMGVFLNNSPVVSPSFVQGIKDAPQRFIAFLQDPLGKKTKILKDNLATLPKVAVPGGLLYKNIAKGVEAAETTQGDAKYVKLSTGAKIQIINIPQPDGTIKKYLKVIKE